MGMLQSFCLVMKRRAALVFHSAVNTYFLYFQFAAIYFGHQVLKYRMHSFRINSFTGTNNFYVFPFTPCCLDSSTLHIIMALFV